MAVNENEKVVQRIILQNGYESKTGESSQRIVYVQDVNGKRTLDLYSGEDPGHKKRIPLKQIPSEVCDFVSLERLWASHNLLNCLPTQLSNLENLKELFLHHNNLKEISLSLCKLPNLEILWLGNNNIERIPYELQNLKYLKRLHLENNLIVNFPDFLCLMSQLEIVYLNQNRLENISREVAKMNSLRRLYLHNNRIRALPRELVDHMQKSDSQLTLITLDHNDIVEIPPYLNQSLKELASMDRRLTLEGCKILPPVTDNRKSSDMQAPRPSGSHTPQSSEVNSPGPGDTRMPRFSDIYAPNPSDLVTKQPSPNP